MSRVYDLPPPRNWQDFEDLCLDLFRKRFNAPMAMKHGRQGQPQAGVDVFGLPTGSAEWFGVQCKKKLGTEVTEAELRDEVEKAKTFNPKLARYVLATTARCDVSIQEVARELTESAPFEVTVYDWDHVCADLAGEPELLRKHFQGFTPKESTVDPTNPAEAVETFRRRQWSDLLCLPSLAQAPGQRHADLLLTDIYTALDVQETVWVEIMQEDPSIPSGPLPDGVIPDSGILQEHRISLPGDRDYLEALLGHEHSRLEAERAERGPKRHLRRCRAIEAAAANRRLVLVGAPGSGKSTFGRFLALCLTGESLGRAQANLSALNRVESGDFVPWPHGAPLSIFVSLQKFQTSEHFPGEGEDGGVDHLLRFLEGLGGDLFGGGLRDALAAEDGALVILDGLDETPSAEASRVQLRRVISGLVHAYPTCRVLVTSRPYAYESGSPWRLDDAGFADVELAPFSPKQQEVFIDAWYQRLVERGLLDIRQERQREMVADLVRQIQGIEYLRPLAESPLMLTMMADLHGSNGGRLPTGGRAALYRESVALLLDRWNETRAGGKPSEDLHMSLEEIRKALEGLAFRVHRSRGVGDGKTPEIQRHELWDALDKTRKAHGLEGAVDDGKIMAYLHQRSGILLGESEEVYRFPHRSYQEYLAATHLVETDFPDLLDQVVTEDPELWREVVPLATGQVQPFMAWTIVERLVPSEPPGDVLRNDGRFFRALLAGLAIRECKLWVKPSEADAVKCKRVRLWLRRAVELGALEVKDRAQAGQILGLLGDDRPGVRLGTDGLPSFQWVEIPSGPFVMGGEGQLDAGPSHEAHVDAYRIARYPVTNAQYQRFIEDGGYTDRWRHCWTGAGWAWKGDRREPEHYSSPFDLPNHPRVRVTWYEAVAYCDWLTEVKGTVHRLPSELEWERAARGTDGRDYPWGPEFDAGRGNFLETGLGVTSAVGLFPSGESPADSNGLGILDGSGNVWEWCSTKGRDGYTETADDDLEGSAVRVLRGGSFAYFDFSARCAYRFRNDPVGFDFVGFRVVAPCEPLNSVPSDL